MNVSRSICVAFILIISICFNSFATFVYAAQTGIDKININQEFGYSEAIVEKSTGITTSITYPRTDLENVDTSMLGWIKGLYEASKKELTFLRRINPRISMEFNLNYNSYLMGGRYAGIEIFGTKGISTNKNEKSIIKTYNISVDGKRILSNDEIISNKMYDDVLVLLKERIINSLGEGYSEQIEKLNGSSLDNIVLTHKGVKVILEKGVYFPESLGTLSYVIKYRDLGEAFRLPDKYFSGMSPTMPIDPNKPIIALTFDDGPGKATEQILDILEDNDARATFCVLGNRVAKNSDTVLRAFQNGNEIVGHSWDHKDLTKLNYAGIKKQLEDTNNAIFDITGIMPAFHRPPYGATNNNVKKASEELSLAMLYWSVDPYDWKTKDAQAIYDDIMGSVKNGSIILCHDIHESTGEAMEMIIPALIEQGYQLVTVSELLNYGENIVESGQLYRKAENLSLTYFPATTIYAEFIDESH